MYVQMMNFEITFVNVSRSLFPFLESFFLLFIQRNKGVEVPSYKQDVDRDQTEEFSPINRQLRWILKTPWKQNLLWVVDAIVEILD